MILELHPKNPEIRILKQISENLKRGEIYIFPTDTVYAIIADPKSKLGVDKIYDLKKIDKHKPFSILCKDISTAAEYIETIPNFAFRLLKKITPGPFTFIFKANKNLSRANLSNEKTKSIGVRIPDSIFISELLKVHEDIIISTSVFSNDEYITETSDLESMYGNRVSAIVDGGIIKVEVSTILDFTSGDMEIVRRGKGIEKIEDN